MSLVRYQGASTQGTQSLDDQVLKLHLIPSGILYPDTVCLIGSGTVVDPKVMLGELSGHAHRQRHRYFWAEAVVHGPRDHALPPPPRRGDGEAAGDRKIGAPRVGGSAPTAPTSFSAAASALDLLDEARLRDRLDGPLKEKNQLLQTTPVEPLDAEDVPTASTSLTASALLPTWSTAPGRSIRPPATANILFEGAGNPARPGPR